MFRNCVSKIVDARLIDLSITSTARNRSIEIYPNATVLACCRKIGKGSLGLSVRQMTDKVFHVVAIFGACMYHIYVQI